MYSREDIVYTYGEIYVTYLEMNDMSIYIKEILGKFPKMQTNISAFFYRIVYNFGFISRCHSHLVFMDRYITGGRGGAVCGGGGLS